MAFYNVKLSIGDVILNEYSGYMKGMKGVKTSASNAAQNNESILIQVFDVAGILVAKKVNGSWVNINT
ncbi:hypothetical protein BCT47_02400 [Vibrio splendidus]|uniref:Uncharacterized protein n=1 Tax=Vibrio atlanticus TaxID=693153 RepID=A0ABV4KSA2_9VIBR|nr:MULTISPECIES: hypothetical protein [Vibrio]OEF68554.1 hypothetical protein A162_22790 [Vibrio tasmaniensis 1F-155]PMG52393.1 hypothetical protein BCU89_03445 [Vibrio splendidus]PMM75980.1 hypothetical protein BCT47_02400 [Vibrio splendidus]PMO81448.1 hypothetical protein BCT01_01360 [Vibrio tasmaniensis]